VRIGAARAFRKPWRAPSPAKGLPTFWWHRIHARRLSLWQSVGMTALDLGWPSQCPMVIASHQKWMESAALRVGVPGLIAAGLGSVGLLFDTLTASRGFADVLEQSSPFERRDSDQLAECRASQASTYPFRDATTLNWLYFYSSELSQKRFILVARRLGAITGFAAFKIYSPSTISLLECRCIDADPRVAKELFQAARLRWRAGRGIYVILAVHEHD